MKLYIKKILAVVLLGALTMPAAMASGSFQAVVSSKSMSVYDRDGSHDYLGALPRGTEVTVLEYSGGVALISWNGRKGLAKVDDMKAVASPRVQEVEVVAKASESELAHAESMVTVKSTKVYQSASSSSKSAKVKKGVSVNVLSTSGEWAKVERDGAVGYMKLSHLSGASHAVQTVEAVAEAVEEAVVKYDDKAVMPTENCRVYSEPSTSSSYVNVEKGTKMTLQAVKGGCAMVSRGGMTGYVDADVLTDYVAPEAEASALTTAEISTAEGVFSGSNEEIVFKFLTKEAGYSKAAACGIVANIKYESGFKPTIVGDSGTSYGICQWHLGRKTRLINWCNSHGYNYKTLKGQLYYLKYELKTYYPAVHNKLKAVSNSAQGAYDAGYYFCYNFEAPASRATRSVTRASYARDTVWKRYA